MPFDDTRAPSPPVRRATHGAVDRVRGFMRRRPWFFWAVVAPTIGACLYMYLLAASQYVSDARFIVRGQQAQTMSILGQVLNGGAAPASSESQAVVSFLKSHDAVKRLRREVDLPAVFHRNGLDLAAGLKRDPTDEDLTRYYLSHVKAEIDTQTGIASLSVRTFRREDSRLLVEKLLEYSEELVNRFSLRGEQDALRVSRTEVDRYAQRLSDLSDQASRFRNQRGALDATSSARVLTDVVGGLEGQLAKAQAELAGARTYLRPGSPRLVELETRVSALRAQVASQRARLTGGEGSLAPTVAGFERIGLDREIANRGYGSALTSLEAARVDAQKQHLYLVRVVEPNLPQKSIYPMRLLTVLGVLGTMLVAYGIGWLMIAGVREHAA